ncbi:MAG: endonuclease/exonuclease/phosphatase family protein [Pseudomonadota bacterium]
MAIRYSVLACALTVSACITAPAGDTDASHTPLDATISHVDAFTLDVADAAVPDSSSFPQDAVLPQDTGHVDAAAPPDVSTPADSSPTDMDLLDADVERDGQAPPDADLLLDASPTSDAADASDAAEQDVADLQDANALTDASPFSDVANLDAGVEDASPAEDAGPTQTVRILAANLSSGLNQSYDNGEGLRIIQGLHPDIVLIQEFNIGDNSPAAVQAFVETACGVTCVYTREPAGAGIIPNGIISRFPIVASGVWPDTSPITNRSYVWARMDVPGNKDLWAVSVHLKASSNAAAVAQRKTEADELVGHLNSTVPLADLLVVGGDLNTYYADTTREPALASFATILVTLPLPDDGTGNTGTSANRLLPTSIRQPYDQVMPDPDLHALSIPVRVGTQLFPNGLVFDSRVYAPLTDVPPVLATDSAALNMQHMAVVRDFSLPL